MILECNGISIDFFSLMLLWNLKTCLPFPGISIFFKCTSTSLFTGGTFLLNFEQFSWISIQHSLKLGCTKDHFRQVKVPGTVPYWKACISSSTIGL